MIILHRKFPPGGVVGQFLRKCSSTDNDVEWANIPSGSSLPDGGTTGQALRKASNADQDVSWQNDPDPFPSGGSTGQVLTKTASGRAWQNVPTELPSGGTSGQILQKTSSGVGWRNTPREVPTGGSSGYFLKKTGSGDNDYSWQYQEIPTIPTHYNQTAFSDWSTTNISSHTSYYNINKWLYAEGSSQGYKSAYEQLAYCYNNKCGLMLRIRVDGVYYMTPVTIQYGSNTFSRVIFLDYFGNPIRLECSTSGVQWMS